MIYSKFSPCRLLQPFVECYFVWQSEGFLATELVVESPPNGFCSIVFNNGDPYFLQNKKYERLEVPAAFIAGQAIYSYKLFLKGIISIAGIVLKPAALATLFKLPTYQYTEERIDLHKVLGDKKTGNIFDQLAAVNDSAAKAKLLQQFLLQHYEARHPSTDFIDEAANLIVEKNGLLHVNDLLQQACMSRRSFERRFFKKVGLSPKYYARIRRMSYLMNMISGKKKIDWQDVFYQCEYYDQSHFIKDFLEFTGRSPQKYIEENMELSNYVQKPRQQSLA